MKKINLFLLSYILFNITARSQVYQLPNGDFEKWTCSKQEEPDNWNTFSSAQCDLSFPASLGCGTVRSVRHERSRDVRPGTAGSFSCKIYATKAFNHIANGSVTTGRIRVGSTDINSHENFVITLRDKSDFNQIFSGKPDSIRFWVKFQCPSSVQEARMNAIIHDDYDFKDSHILNEELLNHIVGIASLDFNRENQEWEQYSVPFNYNYPANNPAYILVTFSTNKEPGKGSVNDILFIDDIELLYNED